MNQKAIVPGFIMDEREVIDRLTATSDALSTAYGYYQQLLCALHFHPLLDRCVSGVEIA